MTSPWESTIVLILVLVEDGLEDCINNYKTNSRGRVLILVLVEDGLEVDRPVYCYVISKPS